MRKLLLGAGLAALAFATSLATGAAAQTTGGAATDPDAPKGKLSDAAAPSAYRLDFTILPDQPRFIGHTEIDVTVKAATSRLYMHGRDLKVSKATATVGGKAYDATFTQVDPTGVARLDFKTPLPAGKATLSFDYDGAFGDTPSGLYRIKVADKWYSWTQFESTDARAAFPSFDEPGFKTPFTVSVTTTPGYVVVGNSPEASVSKAGALEVHKFQATRPLPTYLVAVDTGPFVHVKGAVPPNAHRSTPLPLGAVATQAQAGKLDYVMAETPRIVGLLEDYFGMPFPFPKLDQIASPEMPGAMENAGADTYADDLIVLDKGATTGQKQAFGMVVSHELSHQWFGDLVSPAWWDDIWLNESFANWMGFRIGNAWRPELNIGVGALAEGFGAMNIDALEVGRPIHQPIGTNSEIDSAFDTITYGKGGQVVAMIAAYMGDDLFKSGVRLHLQRHAYGNATTEQFFGSLADAAHDPRILASLKSFVDQPGVPLVSFTRSRTGWTATQSRYAFLGSTPKAETWTIPLCLRAGEARSCTLLDKASMPVASPGSSSVAGVFVPNAGGQGYYRFDLPAADWSALIAALPTLPAGEALAVDDSVWAGFRAGRVPAATLITEARAISGNPDSNASLNAGQRLAGLRLRGLVEGPALADYHKVMEGLYAPKLVAFGLNPAAGAYASEAPDRQKLRQQLVGLVVDEAADAATTGKLVAAAKAYLAGDAKALDQGYLGTAFQAYVADGGVPAAQALADKALASEDAVLRGSALGALPSTGRADVAAWLFGFNDPRLRQLERLGFIAGLARTAETKDAATDWILANFDKLAAGGNGVFVSSRLPSLLSYQCSAERAQRIETQLGAKIRASGKGVLDFERTVEAVRHCGDLKAAKQAELAAALKAAA